MSDDVIKRLLIKLGIDGSDATAFISKLQGALDRLNESQKTSAAERKSAQADDVSAMAKQAELARQQVAVSAEQTANLKEQIEAKRLSVTELQKEIAQERAKLEVRQSTLRIMAMEGQLSGEALKNMEKQIALERQRLVLQQAQLRATGVSNAQRETEKGGNEGGLLGMAAKGLLGKGLVGSIAGGILGGAAAVESVKMLMEGVHELGEALIEASGPAQTLRVEFEKLAKSKGANPEELIQQLRQATRGLVSDSQLFQVSTSFMRQGMKLTTDQMSQLISNTVNLALASGHTAPEALNALTRAFQTGRPFMLAHVTGLTQMDLRMQSLPRNIDPVIAKTATFTKFLEATNVAMKKTGVTATTLPQLFTQLDVAQKDFIEAMAEGVLETGDFGRNIQEMSKKLVDALPKVIEVGKAIGENLADAMKWLIDHWPEIKTGLEVITAVKLVDWAAGGAAAIWKLVDALNALKVAQVGESLAGAFPGVGSLLGQFGKTAEKVPGGVVAGSAEGAAESVAGGMAGGAAGGAGVGLASGPLLAIAAGIAAITVVVGLAWRKWGGAEMRGEGQKGSFDINPQTGQPFYRSGREAEPFEKDKQNYDYMRRQQEMIAAPPSAAYAEATKREPPKEKEGQVSLADLQNMEEMKKLASLKATIAREQAKLELDQAKEEADAELEILKSKYARGLIEMDQYVAAEKAIRTQEYTAQVDELGKEREAEKAAIAQKHAEDKDLNPQAKALAKEAERKEEEAVDAKFDIQEQQAYAAHLKVLAGLNDKAAEDHKAAEKTLQQEILKLQKDGLTEQQSLLEKQFKQGNVGPNDYIAKRRDMIQQEAQLVQNELAQELADTSKSEDEKAKIRVKGIEAALTAQKQLTDFDQTQEQIQVQAIEASYSRIKADLEHQQAAAQLGVQQRTPGSRGDETKILQEMLDANRLYIAQLTQRLSLEKNEPELWAKTVDQIKAATDQQIKWNQQLADAKNYAAPLAGLMGSIGDALGKAGATNAEQVLRSMTESLEQISKLFSQSSFKIGFHTQKPKPVNLPALPEQKAAQTPAAAEAEYTKTLQQNIESLKSAATKEANDRAAATDKLIKDLNALGLAAEHTTAKLSGGAAVPKVPELAGPQLDGRAPAPILPPVGPAPIVAGGGMSIPTTTNTSPTSIGTQGGGAGSAGGGSSQGPGNVISEFVQGIKSGGAQMQAALNDMAKALSAAVSSVGNFISSLKGAKSGAGGALSGGLSGLSMGMQVGGMFGPMGAAIGAIAGGIGGAITGGIVGHKEAEMKKDVKLVQDQLQNIVDQLNAGTISMADALAQLRQERMAAISMLSGGKGGKGKKGQPSQLQTVLEQIDQQIQQLVNEQNQLIDQMNQNILEMGQGIYWQPVLNQLDQIVQKYQQFASAAQGNTQEVAAANQFLTTSLENYSQTMQQTFLADQEQAIQNALQLLQLEQEQAEMANQYQSQVYGILTQGVTSRQMSGAQTKGGEIEALNQQYSQQQQQMQQEIAVAQYKYQIQQQIFGLASTQVGLEMELVAVQEQQANNTQQSVVVLQQAIEAINEALATGNLPGLLTGVTSTGTQGLTGILQLLGLNPTGIPGVTGGGINYLSELPNQWQGIINFMNTIDPNFTMDVIQAMMSAPGSAARQNLVSLIANPTYGLGTSAQMQYGTPYLQQFEQWITSGASLPAGTPVPSPQPGGYAEGTTYVPQTGIAQLEQGEAVIPSAMNPWGGDASGGTPFAIGMDQQSVNSSTSAAMSDANLQVEQQIYQLVMSRVSAEWNLVQAKIQLLQAEQSNATGGVTSFEGGMQKVFELRGRYGSGGARTQYL